MRLSLKDFDGCRENNLTAIRILLAWAVLYGHSYAVQNTMGLDDPLNRIFKGSIWIGALAVNGFFLISGFLVAGSIERRGVFNYLVSRVLRIYPALICCVLLSALLIGPVVSALDFGEYFQNVEVYQYLKNLFGLFWMHQVLPGVFISNAKRGFNGSLWTLQVEIWCYLLLAGLFVLGGMKNRLVANVVIVGLFFLGWCYLSDLPLLGGNTKWVRLAGYFLLGMFFYTNRAQVVLDKKLCVMAAFIAFFSFGTVWFDYVFPFVFAYLVFAAAYLFPYMDADGTIGDLSYGIYIYAWPTQQVVASLSPASGPIFNTFVASIVVFLLALMSWRFVERPSLALKRYWLSDAQ